jgi:hypothetical protein
MKLYSLFIGLCEGESEEREWIDVNRISKTLEEVSISTDLSPGPVVILVGDKQG